MRRGIFLLFFYMPIICVANVKEIPKTAEEKNNDLLDFSSIRDILKSDQLEDKAVEKKISVKTIKKKRIDHNLRLYQLPLESDFWSFFTEYWLVKNAPVLNWDFAKPDYGVAEAFEQLLEKMGYFEVKFRILMVNTPNVMHFALPSSTEHEATFLLSVPFIRALDLSKLEIALLLLEDYQRLRTGHFQGMVTVEELGPFLGSNFKDKKLDLSIIQKLSKKYDEVIFDTGFQFQQQFEITKQMDSLLKSDLSLWNTYYTMIQKKDKLVKSNILYLKYSQLYPSPELQLSWLRPKISPL